MSAPATAPAIESITATAETCDRCGARAVVAAAKDGNHLTFCGHHGRLNRSALLQAAFAIRGIEGPGAR